MRESGTGAKALRARELGVYRGSFYYKPRKPDKDWALKVRIEEVLRQDGCHSYGSRRIAWHLNINRKRVKRVMNLFGIKAYRRRGRKWKKTNNIKAVYPNLLLTEYPSYENHIWVSDFTRIPFQDKIVYVATVEDLYTRKIVGAAVYTTHAVQLVLSAFMNAIGTNARPAIFHSDNGSEYDSKVFIEALETLGIMISRSAPGCPWENGYQESFYDKFKIDLGDTSRFATLGELVYAIYRQIWLYNNQRIHSALRMPPVRFALEAVAKYNSGIQD
ncbi:MAG: IS3 family transposase [Patescibacteria group bacterium]|nr:IS3 family transposase [Patescibacteria group bacterium]